LRVNEIIVLALICGVFCFMCNTTYPERCKHSTGTFVCNNIVRYTYAHGCTFPYVGHVMDTVNKSHNMIILQVCTDVVSVNK